MSSSACRYGSDVPDVVMTTQGGAEITRAIVNSGALLGMASSQSRLRDYGLDFVDWPFSESNPSWRDHIAMVRRHEPRYAVAPDVQEGRSLDWVLEKADALAQYADCVIVVPKDVHPRAIPDRFRVGLPFQKGLGPGGVSIDDDADGQTTLGGRSNSIYDFASRRVGDVHVLGGAPHDQLRIPSLGIDVRSVDTSLPLVYSQFGDVWTRAGRIEFGRDVDYYKRVTLSLKNVLRAWGHDVSYDPWAETVIEKAEELASMSDAEKRRRLRGRGPPPVSPRGHGDDDTDALSVTIDNLVRHEYEDLEL